MSSKKGTTSDADESNMQMMTEERWREIILGYFKETQQNVSKYLHQNGITQFRDKFDKRFKRSGLKDLRKQNKSYKKAVVQYDRWMAEEAKSLSVSKNKPKFTEEQWRDFILVYYQLEKKSVTKFLDEMGIQQRDVFINRWKDSGLKGLKAKGFSLEGATAQYNFWFGKWKNGYAIMKQHDSHLKSCQSDFQIHEDTEAERIAENQKGVTESIIAENENDVAESIVDIENSYENNDGSDNNSDCNSNSTRNVFGDVSNRDRENKLSNLKMYETIAAFYECNDGSKFLSFVKTKGLFSNRKAIARHWKESGLAEMKEQSESIVTAMVK
jgi:hypothetical protein